MNTAHYKKVARVALFGRLPRDKDFFSYQVPIKLIRQVAAGDLVQVNFRQQKTLGLILGFESSKPNYPLKDIQTIKWPKFLSSGQLKLLARLAHYYAVSMSTASQLFIPFPVTTKEHVIIRPQQKIKKALPTSKPLLITYGQRLEAEKFIQAAINKVIGRQQQVLLLVPNIKLILDWQNKLFQANQIVGWHSELKTSAKRITWQKVFTGEAKIIIGTRSALFLPWLNLGGVIIDYGDDENYKQYDQNPRYNSIEVARWLKQIYGCSLAQVTPAPRAEDYYLMNKEWQLQNLGLLFSGRLTIVDISANPTVSKQLALSSWEQITASLESKQKVLIWHNRLGSSTAVFCRDCKYIPRCQKCLKPLSWHHDKRKLACHNCQTISELPARCPKCQNVQWKFLGVGSQEIEHACRQRYPDVHICRVDYNTKTKITVKEIKSAQIVISTSLIWDYAKVADFALLVITSFDQNLLSPEFRAEETAGAILRKILSESDSVSVLLETNFPESPVLKYLTNNNQFYRYLLSYRQLYYWPPFSQLVRLSVKNKNQLKARQAIIKLRQQLIKVLSSELVLSPIYADSRIIEHGQYIYHLLLKCPKKFKIESLWPFLPRQLIIDREPRFILS